MYKETNFCAATRLRGLNTCQTVPANMASAPPSEFGDHELACVWSKGVLPLRTIKWCHPKQVAGVPTSELGERAKYHSCHCPPLASMATHKQEGQISPPHRTATPHFPLCIPDNKGDRCGRRGTRATQAPSRVRGH